MLTILAYFRSFAGNPDARFLTGLLFLTLLGFLFYRYTGGLRNVLFVLAAVVSGSLFILSPAAHLFGFVLLFMLYGALEVRRLRERAPYQPARATVESGGIKRGLTPPEAAVLLEKPLNTVVGLVLAGLVRKGVVTQVRENPIVLEVAVPFQLQADEPHTRMALRREAAQANGVIIHPYEEPFLALIENHKSKPVETLNLVAPARTLLRHTARRVQGYNLPETRGYYQKHLGRARHDAKHAGANGCAERVKAHNFEWMVLDDRVAEVYGAVPPAWLPAADPSAWVARLMAAAATTVPPARLQVRDAEGRRLAIGGRDPIRREILEAVAHHLG